MRLIRRTRRTVWYHLGLLGTSGRYGYFWLHIWAGRGSEPVWRRCPETPPKVRAIHWATSGGPNLELIKALKKVCPPPLKMNEVCETVPNLKRINRWMSTLGKHTIDNITTQEPAAKRIRFDSATILKSMKNKAWRTFDKNKILALDFRHNDDHFFYAEIVLDWISFTKPCLLVVQELWGSIKQGCLQYGYVQYLWNFFFFHQPSLEASAS